MQLTRSIIPDVMILEPRVFEDDRGFFLESWNARDFKSAVGIDVPFVQDNQSRSRRGVLRGLHYQIKQPQGKLVSAVRGSVFDVAVDLRKSSASFGKWFGAELNETNHRQVWIPAGFAHGYLVLSETADLLYKTTDFYEPKHERCLMWNDPEIGIEWPLAGEAVLSAKDRQGLPLSKAELFE
jgi:dTDP-4-dehydrorhamnose 3,5-epimerase